MARTLPPYYVPYTHVFDGENYLELPIEIRSDSSSTGGYLSHDSEDSDRGEDPQHCTEGRKSPKEQSPIAKETNSSSIDKSTPSPKKKSSPSIKKSTFSPDNKCPSLSMIRHPSQTFPPKPRLKSITKFKTKLPIRRKKSFFPRLLETRNCGVSPQRERYLHLKMNMSLRNSRNKYWKIQNLFQLFLRRTCIHTKTLQ